ncbi:MAG: hypothetical protein K1X64_16215 [Myxococcaceae bacterium]|nr:hypothetical protein [Myxococcaceae bacterium]
MRRRYTIHKDGDLLVEELDDKGQAIDPEPVPSEERLPIEVVLSAPANDDDAKAALLDLLELALSMEAEPPDESEKKKSGIKLNVIS